ncbi:uncharacterized protein J7T54_006173 [Emericellopsis cladophorae]|uniref:Tubulin-specific chaperone A n=1 Tax=Emericellopsis cladophorae TaxID=2686198 RepID=A0A9P9YA94_9HYPO|nr:uncharacterized protein J7T54_006173 [Emericellopsis cladophorae]KAI6785834.1 hypothetical protein J7T54_006173 [Emericellopsis cladophorae]
MPAPSQLTIATSSVLRLLKEEITYHKELVDQEAKIKILEEKINSGAVTSDDNQEFMLKQERTAAEQTKAVFVPLKQKIEDAVTKLEEQIALKEAEGGPEAEIEQAKAVLGQAKAAIN